MVYIPIIACNRHIDNPGINLPICLPEQNCAKLPPGSFKKGIVMRIRSYEIIALCCLLISGIIIPKEATNSQIQAFQGAEGFGAYAKGGRGGRILEVTTVEDTGAPGSLRWAIEQNFPRIIQFKVGGIFELEDDLEITSPFITLDGSDAPLPGVTLKDGGLIVKETHDVIIRYIRARPGDEVALKKGKWKNSKRKSVPHDGISVNYSENVIIDHCSASWSSDEALSVTRSSNVTVQWCIISEPLANPKLHLDAAGDEQSHAFGAMVNGNGVSYIKNIIAFYRMRGPQLSAHADNSGGVQLAAVNNFVCKYEDSGSRIKPTSSRGDFILLNNSYAMPLKNDAPDIDIVPSKKENPTLLSRSSAIYLKGNIGPVRNADNQDEWAGVSYQIDPSIAGKLRIDSPPFAIDFGRVYPAQKVARKLLQNAGATLPTRDKVDRRIVNQIRRNEGRVIDSQDDVGGY